MSKEKESKKLSRLSAVFCFLVMFTILAMGCRNSENIDDSSPPENTPVSTRTPAAEELSAASEQEVTAVPQAEVPGESPLEEEDVAVPTDVISVVIVASRAELFSGPGGEYPVIATALGSTNYPVNGISKDGNWWRLTCYDDSVVLIEECWISADPSIAMPTNSTALSPESDIKPYIELTFEFLRAIQSGLTAAGSADYLSSDLQTIVEAGRPLPTLFGVRDAFPSFVMTDFSDPQAPNEAKVRIRFNYDTPSYAVVHLIREEGDWQISQVAAHNLVNNFGTNELMQAESVINTFYEALAAGDGETASSFLTAAAQENTSQRDFVTDVEGLRKLVVATMQPVRGSSDQLVYYVRLLAEPASSSSTAQNSSWQDGENARWVTMIQDRSGWSIAGIDQSPILTQIDSWQRVNILPINMTLDIPADWTRAGLQWAWSPNSLGTPGMGVSWTDLGEFGGDETLLPRYRRDISSKPIDLGWAQGTEYNFELVGGTGENSISAETHMIVKTGRRAYDFHANAPTVEELDNMKPILQRMVAAVSINDPRASAFNSVEATVSFLATLLRDGTGASSLPFLSDDLIASDMDQTSLLALLGVDTLFESFKASWLQNPEEGQALVAVTLYFEDETREFVFTVQRDSEDSWLISDMKRVD